jgi:hypothetical protein
MMAGWEKRSQSLLGDGNFPQQPRIPRAPVAAREEGASDLVQMVLDVPHVGITHLDGHGEEGRKYH